MLAVWLPLTKDLRNQGLDDMTITTANTNVFQNEGKLGSKSLDVSGHYAFRVPSLVKKRVFSCSFWYKPITDSSLSDNWRRIVVFDTYTSDGSTTGAIFRFESSYGYQSSSTTYCISIHNNVGEPIASIGTGLGETDGWNKWQHIAITADGTTLRCYRNGTQVATGSMSNGGMLQGTVHIGYSGNRPVGRLNDFRLYDHCLSPMEVKELAKGLVLHYPLDRQGWGQENLLLNSNIEKSGKNTIITYDLSTEGITAVKGATMRISADIKSDVANAIIDCYVRSSTSNSMCSNTIFTGIGTTYQRYTMTTVCNTNQDKTPQWFAFRCNGSNGTTTTATFTIKNVKLELGEITTPWCPNSSDALATTMGLNSTTEYDCSGFCNNGTRTGTFTWTSNTPKYAVSQVFNGTDNAIQTPSLPTMITDKNYTIAVWIYKTAIGSKNYQTIYGGPSGFELEARNATTTEAKFVGWNWGKPVAAYEFNKWNHCVFVHSDDDCKVYLNGEYVATGTAKASNPSGNYFVGAWNTATQQNFEGLMSDFRIYATALSASDVKSLYQNSAYIDSSGNVYGAVHSEV